MNQSVDWWKERANKVVGKLELLEKKFAEGTANEEDDAIYLTILEETKILIARGEIENEILEKLEDNARKFLKGKRENGNDPG